MNSFRHILVPIDFGPSSKAALEVATDLAVTFGAALTILHVCEIPTLAYSGMDASTADLVTPLQEAAETEMLAVRTKIAARVSGVTTECRLGFAWEEILDKAQSVGADLIVLGTHGRRGLPRILLGSIAERVVRLSKVPVLTVRGAT